MPPPPMTAAPSLSREPTRARVSRPSPPPPQPSLQSEALFVTEADDDRRWDPANFDEEEDEMLLWDTPGDKVSVFGHFLYAVDVDGKLGNCDNELRTSQGIRQPESKY
jgi:hypothetical protein